MLQDRKKIIFVDDFYRALVNHHMYNSQCASGGVIYFHESMVCQKCGQIWYRQNLSSVFDQSLAEPVRLAS